MFEAVTEGDDVIVVMEHVDGATLGAWLRSRRRSRRDILGAFIAASRGLEAAHRAGLVHRDFKPDNVLVGVDGRVRVTDFGLARTTEDDPRSGDAGSTLAASVAGGTPAYMAPEQHHGAAADARADQFALCVALYEALCGQHPFGGDTYAELRGNVLAGRVHEPARRVPTWIRRPLMAGLAVRPEARHPSMRALIDALERDPFAPARRAMPFVGAAAAIGVIALALGRGREPPPCAGAAHALDGAWGSAGKEAVRRAFAGSGAPNAADTFQRVAAIVDDYARAYAATRTDACEATAVRRTQPASLLDLRMACLDQALAGFRDMHDIWAKRLGPDHPWVAVSLLAISDCLSDLGRDPEAQAAIEEARAIQEKVLPPRRTRRVTRSG